jgi:hypothetical protein
LNGKVPGCCNADTCVIIICKVFERAGSYLDINCRTGTEVCRINGSSISGNGYS